MPSLSALKPSFHGKTEPKRIDLALFEVVIDLYDPNLGIMLEPLEGVNLQRVRLRATSEPGYKQWIERLVAATKWARRQYEQAGPALALAVANADP